MKNKIKRITIGLLLVSLVSQTQMRINAEEKTSDSVTNAAVEIGQDESCHWGGALRGDINLVKDHIVELTPSESKARISYPSKVDLSKSDYFPPIGDQDELGSCASFAITYYQFTYEANKLNNISSKIIENTYSPKWTYNYTNGGINKGSRIYDIYEFLKERGAVKWNEFKYDGSDANKNFNDWCKDENAMLNALKTRVKDWDIYDFDTKKYPITSPNSSSINSLKKLLQNHVLTIYVAVDKKLDDNFTTDKTETGEEIICRASHDKWETGHAMTVVGYDDNIWVDINKNGVKEPAEKGALKVANSHGIYSYNNGYIWVAYDALNYVSQVPGNWESEFNNNRCCIFDEFGTNTNHFYQMTVENKDVDVVAKVQFSAVNRYNIYYEMNKTKSGYYYRPITLKTYIKSGTPNMNSSVVLLYDYSDLNMGMKECTGICNWKLKFKNNNLQGKTAIGNCNYSLVDSNNNVIAKYPTITGLADFDVDYSIQTNMKKGSVDFNSTIDMNDVNTIQKYAIGSLKPSNLQKFLADYDGNNIVDLKDAKAVLAVVNGAK